RTEYWKSQPKKFCQYCKCWIADNKPSIEFHERGKNHKENVHAKISESIEFHERGKNHKENVHAKISEKSASSPWVEAFTAEGYTYYYNTITGESKWENPESSVSPPGVAQDEGSGDSAESVEPPSLEPDSESAEHSTEEGGGAEPAAQNTEEGGGAEPAAQNTEEGGGVEPAAQNTEERGGAEPAALGEAQKHKISFRWKSPAEEKSNLSEENSKSEDEEETKEETSSPDAEEESKAKRKQKSNPYGVWEQIQEEEEDPYKQVDMQLPQVESYPSGPDIPQEPKVKFKERTITSLGDETGEAVVFKKRKLENGKSRNLRQRRTDE
ncbi:UNVERIFIED_CONTAM: hypothetical protein FKN15_025910, partial [Acipenser sinensis]